MSSKVKIVLSWQKDQIELLLGKQSQGIIQFEKHLVCLPEQMAHVVKTLHLRGSEATILLPEALTKMKILQLPMVNRGETQKMIALALEKSADFQEKFAFDFQIMDLSLKEQQTVVTLYAPLVVVDNYLKYLKSCHLQVKRIASVGDGLLAALTMKLFAEQTICKPEENYSFFYWLGDQALVIFVINGQLVQMQYYETVASVETLCIAYTKENNMLNRRYDLPKIMKGYLFMAKGTVISAELLQKQLAYYTNMTIVLLKIAENMISAIGEGHPPLNWPMLGLLMEGTDYGV